jgi:hypothetical protein
VLLQSLPDLLHEVEPLLDPPDPSRLRLVAGGNGRRIGHVLSLPDHCDLLLVALDTEVSLDPADPLCHLTERSLKQHERCAGVPDVLSWRELAVPEQRELSEPAAPDGEQDRPETGTTEAARRGTDE